MFYLIAFVIISLSLTAIAIAYTPIDRSCGYYSGEVDPNYLKSIQNDKSKNRGTDNVGSEKHIDWADVARAEDQRIAGLPVSAKK